VADEKLGIKGTVILVIVMGACFLAYHRWFASEDLTLTVVETSQLAGELTVAGIQITNSSSMMDIKDPVIACDALGASGTVITTLKQPLYEIIPAKKTWSSPRVLVMGAVPDQAATFKCRISDATPKW